MLKYINPHMPRRLLTLIGLLLMLCLAVVGCTDSTPTGDTDSTAETLADSNEESTSTTESIAESDSEAESASSGWVAETGVFNEGKVVYTKEVETEILEAFPTEQLGKPAERNGKGVETIFYTDFSGTDASLGGKGHQFHPNTCAIVDGRLYVQYDANSANGFGGSWTTWTAVPGASLSTYQQVELSMKWELYCTGNNAHTAPTIGCYVSNYIGKIPDNPGDGLWISFIDDGNRLAIYHPDERSWAEGFASVPVAEGLMNGEHEVSVVCSPDRTTRVYITAAGTANARLVCIIKFADGKIRVYDEGETMVAESNCTTNALKGENFPIFCHAGAGAKIDELALLGAVKGQVVEHINVTATPTEGNSLGLDITDKKDLVSINYSVWFDAILGSGSEKVEQWNNITEALAGRQPWGGVTAFHYWAKPAEGYYRSSDKDVIRKHMTQLYTAGVDFINIDLTNAGDGYLGTGHWTNYIQKPMDAICDTIMEMRAEGLGTPYVVFWVGDGEGPLYKELYDKYHAVEKWKDCFVYWEGKPFMLTTHKQPADFPYNDLLTVRSMWGLRGAGGYAEGQWSFINIDNKDIVALDKNGNPEQMSVAVASQETYMSQPSAHGREGGMFWAKQWYYAFETRPKIITLTWWNEWTAQRFEVDGLEGPQFVDNYNQAFSRDIEPMEGGHGDQYYQWLIQYISAYKGGQEWPMLVEDNYVKKLERWLKQISKAN